MLSTAEYCKRKGNDLRATYLNLTSFEVGLKRKELINILRISEKSDLKQVYRYSDLEGWNRFALETSDNKLIPLLHLAPANKSLGYVIICNPKRKDSIPLALVDGLKKKGSGMVLLHYTEQGSAYRTHITFSDTTAKFHYYSCAGVASPKTILGEWAKELR